MNTPSTSLIHSHIYERLFLCFARCIATEPDCGAFLLQFFKVAILEKKYFLQCEAFFFSSFFLSFVLTFCSALMIMESVNAILLHHAAFFVECKLLSLRVFFVTSVLLIFHDQTYDSIRKKE